MAIEDEQTANWHLDKRINLSHLGTTIGLVIAAMVWGSSVETRLSLGEQARSQQTEILQDIRAEQRELNGKIDRFLEELYKLKGKLTHIE